MKRIQAQALRGALLAGIALASIALAQSAFAAHTAADEVGRWVGFGHQAGQLVAGSHVTLDLAGAPAGTPGALTGVLNGLPAIQTPVNVTGFVTSDGLLFLAISGGGAVGFCDGSVRNLLGFGAQDGPDKLGGLFYVVTDANGMVSRGRLNLIHLYGGLDWAQIVAPNVLGMGDGSAVPGGADVAVPSKCMIGSELGSSISGNLTINDGTFDMVGTINGPGSTVMMCDGSVRNADGTITGLIGLLFAGGARNMSPVGVPAVQDIVGRYGIAPFANLLPAVQSMRDGALSILIGL